MQRLQCRWSFESKVRYTEEQKELILKTYLERGVFVGFSVFLESQDQPLSLGLKSQKFAKVKGDFGRRACR
jgi:hypothetical protein